MSEAKRLATLQRYEILNSGPEAAYDDVAALAAEIAGVHLALVSFVDSKRVWFKATVGTAIKEVPRTTSFCNLVVESEETLVIDDAFENLFTDSSGHDRRPEIDQKKIRFYAGFPLKSPEGYVLGTLCLVDFHPKSLSTKQIESLRRLAGVITGLLEARLVAKEQAETTEVVQLLNRIAVAANESAQPAECIQKCLAEVGAFTNSPVGHYLKVSETEPALLITSKLWWIRQPVAYENFQQATEVLKVEKGVGTSGRAFEAAEAFCNLPVPPDNPRIKIAQALGLHTAFAFPVIVKNEVVGVFEFFRGPLVENTELLMRIVTHVGAQVAHSIERAQAEESLEKQRDFLNAVLESLTNGVIACDENAKLTLFNRVFAEMHGQGADHQLPPDQWAQQYKLLRPNGELLATDEVPLFQAFSGRLVRNEEMTILHPSGRRMRLICNASSIFAKDGRKIGAVAAMQDVTELKSEQERLLETNHALRAATAAKSEFLANMSHEIRTPLNGVMGMAELLLSSSLTNDQHEQAEIILSSSQNLLTIISDILDFSKIEAGKLDIEKVPFDILESVGDVQRKLQFAATRKNLRLVSDFPVPTGLRVLGDPHRLRQIMTNLLSNAVKFSSEGEVKTSIRFTPVTGGRLQVRIEVSDTGIGMSQETQTQLFRAFSQADSSTTRKYGGTGLGLSISKRLIDLMEGQIGVESWPGLGSMFWINLELEVASAHLDSALSLASSDPLKTNDFRLRADAKILLAEDNPVNQVIAIKMLAKLGLKADAVASGRAVLEAVSTTSYDLILMDCQMPDMDGYEATRILRLNSNEVAIVALTANAMKGDCEKCIKAGMDDYMTKPVKLDELAKVISRNLREKVAG